MPQTTALSDLKELQEQLDETDRALLKALEKRFELCREMTAAKLENNVGVMQPVEIDRAVDRCASGTSRDPHRKTEPQIVPTGLDARVRPQRSNAALLPANTNCSCGACRSKSTWSKSSPTYSLTKKQPSGSTAVSVRTGSHTSRSAAALRPRKAKPSVLRTQTRARSA
jgi:chorismate mutase